MIDQPEITQLAELRLVHCFSTIVELSHGRRASRTGEQKTRAPGWEVRGVVDSGYTDREDGPSYPCGA